MSVRLVTVAIDLDEANAFIEKHHRHHGKAAIMTDDAKYYRPLDKDRKRDSVNHSADEWVREEAGKPLIHTNTVESYFSVFKRGMRGTYQHCSEKHLHRYLAEFDFRYNARSALGVEDEERTGRALAGIRGKRLTYRDSSVPADRAKLP